MARPESRFNPDNYFLQATAIVIKRLDLKKKFTQESLAKQSDINLQYLQEQVYIEYQSIEK